MLCGDNPTNQLINPV